MMSQSAAVAITTVLFILVVVDIVGNCLVCAIIKKNRDMRIPINYLLVNLAVSDILYATFIASKVLLELTFTHPDGMTGTVLCKVLTGATVAWIGAISSILTLLSIAIERYYAVMYPHGNKGKLTRRKLKVIIPVIWVIALIFNIPLFLVADTEKKSSTNPCLYLFPEVWMGKAFSLTWLLLADLSFAMMAVLYSRVVYALWFKRDDDNQLTHQQRGAMRVRKRVTMMVVVVSVIFGICWGVNTLVYVLIFFTSYNIGSVPVATANTMVLFNSAVNPFVYALLNQQFREKIKRMICCSLAARVHPEPQDTQLVDNTTHPTHTSSMVGTG